MATDNVSVVRRFVEELWNRGNLDAAAQLVWDRYVGHEPMLGEIRGAEAVKTQIKSFREAFPDLHTTIEEIGMAGGDRVFVRWTARGTHKGPFMGIAATNKSGEVKGMAVYKIAHGKVAEGHAVYDTLTLFQRLGLAPQLDEMARGSQARAGAPASRPGPNGPELRRG